MSNGTNGGRSADNAVGDGRGSLGWFLLGVFVACGLAVVVSVVGETFASPDDATGRNRLAVPIVERLGRLPKGRVPVVAIAGLNEVMLNDRRVVAEDLEGQLRELRRQDGMQESLDVVIQAKDEAPWRDVLFLLGKCEASLFPRVWFRVRGRDQDVPGGLVVSLPFLRTVLPGHQPPDGLVSFTLISRASAPLSDAQKFDDWVAGLPKNWREGGVVVRSLVTAEHSVSTGYALAFMSHLAAMGVECFAMGPPPGVINGPARSQVHPVVRVRIGEKEGVDTVWKPGGSEASTIVDGVVGSRQDVGVFARALRSGYVSVEDLRVERPVIGTK